MYVESKKGSSFVLELYTAKRAVTQEDALVQPLDALGHSWTHPTNVPHQGNARSIL
jgi:hypothetical protein